MRKRRWGNIVAGFAAIGLFVLLIIFICWFDFKIAMAPCIPCGYINYDKKVEDGFEEQLWGYCMPCKRAADPVGWIGIYMTHRRALRGCPPIYREIYNKKVAELNAQLVCKGYQPRFEPIE